MELFLPFLLLIFASFFQGTFGLGMKYMNPMSWESWWVIHVLVAMILFPMIWAYIAIPINEITKTAIIYGNDG